MAPFATLQGVFVRAEPGMYIIWTKEVNHIYVRAANFNSSLFAMGDRIEVDVFTNERSFCQYRYEGFKCRLPQNRRTEHSFRRDDQVLNKFACRRDSKGRPTIMWKGQFAMTAEHPVHPPAGVIIENVQDLDRGLRIRAFMPKQDEEFLTKRGIETFSCSVTLYHSVAQGNDCPWKFEAFDKTPSLMQVVQETDSWDEFDDVTTAPVSSASVYGANSTQARHDCKQQRQLKAALPSHLIQGSVIDVPSAKPAAVLVYPEVTNLPQVDIHGVCLYLENRQCYYFYRSKDDGDEKYFGSLLKISYKLDLKVGEWYRLRYTVNYDLGNYINCDNIAPSTCFSMAEPCQPPRDKMIYRFFPYTKNDQNGVISIIFPCSLQLQPEAKLYSEYISEIFDDNGIMAKVAGDVPISIDPRYIVEVAVKPHGFVVTKCFGLDRGYCLDDYLSQSEYPIHINGVRYYTYECFENWSSQKHTPGKSQGFLNSAIPGASASSHMEVVNETDVADRLGPGRKDGSNKDDAARTELCKSLADEREGNDRSGTGTDVIRRIQLATLEKYMEKHKLASTTSRSLGCAANKTAETRNGKTTGLLKSEVVKDVLRCLNTRELRNIIERQGKLDTLQELFRCLDVGR